MIDRPHVYNGWRSATNTLKTLHYSSIRLVQDSILTLTSSQFTLTSQILQVQHCNNQPTYDLCNSNKKLKRQEYALLRGNKTIQKSYLRLLKYDSCREQLRSSSITGCDKASFRRDKFIEASCWNSNVKHSHATHYIICFINYQTSWKLWISLT